MRNLFITDYSDMKPVDFAAKLAHIAACTTANEDDLYVGKVPPGVPTPQDFTEMATQMGILNQAAANGDRAAIIGRDSYRGQCAPQVRNGGLYFEIICNGDVEKAKRTGYDLRSQPVRSTVKTVPPAPKNVKVKRGVASGSLIVSCEKIKSAVNYMAQVCCGDTSVEANWGNTVESVKPSRICINGLTKLKEYAIRVRAYSAQGWGPWAVIAPIGVL